MANTPTAAALVLLNAGVSGRELAEALGVTPQAVSYQLAGKSAETSRELLDAIAARAGADVAGEVADAITLARADRKARP